MLWFIVSIITGATLYGGHPHAFSSVRHFATEAECIDYLPADAEELQADLDRVGEHGPYHVESHCEQEGEPA